MAVIHEAPDKHEPMQRPDWEIPSEFLKRMNMSDLVISREHQADAISGTIYATPVDASGRKLMIGVLDRNTPAGWKAAEDVRAGRITETSISMLPLTDFETGAQFKVCNFFSRLGKKFKPTVCVTNRWRWRWVSRRRAYATAARSWARSTAARSNK